MRTKTGILLFCIGLMSADTELIIIPLILITAGLILARDITKRED